MKILITGVAGFIGSHLAEKLLDNGHTIIGIDIINNYYSIKQKEANLHILNKYPKFTFIKEDVIESQCVTLYKPDVVCHLASMAGVRYSLEDPILYAKTNIVSQINLLEQCVKCNIQKYIYASSSSVYGLNTKIPFSEDDPIKQCNSPYAVSKYAMENYANLYHKLYNISVIGLRFFTVYGPRGRPDMAPYKFLKAIMNSKSITKYGDGYSARDYTYIDDIISGIINCINTIKENQSKIYNLGNNKPILLNDFISTCEEVVGKNAEVINLPNQTGDVPITYANISQAQKDLGYNPKTQLKEGLFKTYQWLKTLENN